jgi:exopolysaccharide production protein ExoY
MSELTAIAERPDTAAFPLYSADHVAPIAAHPLRTPPAVVANSVLRLIDILVATLAIIFLLPLMLLVAVAVACTSRGPILFKHGRIGMNGEIFPCFKFRSMEIDAEARLLEILQNDPEARAEWARDQKLRKDPRITPIGRFLRSSSLDELPQFLNVLRGDMSIVGPRPIIAAEMVRYGRYIERYKAVKPGITGLWQISGRNNVTYQRRVAMDVLYTRKRSIRMNMRIIVLTAPMVIFAKGSF